VFATSISPPLSFSFTARRRSDPPISPLSPSGLSSDLSYLTYVHANRHVRTNATIVRDLSDHSHPFNYATFKVCCLHVFGVVLAFPTPHISHYDCPLFTVTCNFPFNGPFFFVGSACGGDGLRGAWAPTFPAWRQHVLTGIIDHFSFLRDCKTLAHFEILTRLNLMRFLCRDLKLLCSFNVNSKFSPWCQGGVLRLHSFEFSVLGQICRLLTFQGLLKSSEHLFVTSPVAIFCFPTPSVFIFTLCFFRVRIPIGYPQDICVNVCLLFGSYFPMRFHLYTSNHLFCIYLWSFGCLPSSAIGFRQLLDVLGWPCTLSDFRVRRGFSV
jgi:hypothetical protein